MRLHRPYIPWSVRELVVLLQLRAAGINVDEKPYVTIRYHGSAETRVRAYLRVLFGDGPVELHHRPALVNRRKVYHWVRGERGHGRFVDGGREFVDYDPPANDPDYLVYLRAGAGEEHDVETRVRGQHGQHSDLALARKQKRKARKERRRKLLAAAGKPVNAFTAAAGKPQKFKHPRRRLRSRSFERRQPQRSATRPIAR